MAAPILQVEYYTSVSGVASVSVSVPAGISAGDLLLLVGVSDGEATTDDQWSTSETGFTKLGEVGDGTTDVKLAVFWKIATGSESGTMTLDHAVSGYLTGWIAHITGNDTTSPFNVSMVETAGGVANSLALTTGTTTVDECLCFAMAAFDGADGGGFAWSGTGWTEIVQRRNPVATVSYGLQGGWATLTQTTAGSVATPTVSTSGGVSDGLCGLFFAVSPPVAASGDITHWNVVALADISALNEVTSANIDAINGVTY